MKGKNDMTEEKAGKKLGWFSFHMPNNGQMAMLPVFGADEFDHRRVTFGEDPIGQVRTEGYEPGEIIAIVAPMSVCLPLLRAGYELVEFQNRPSAREKGLFLCVGAWVHTSERSEFFFCPLSADEQEAGRLDTWNK